MSVVAALIWIIWLYLITSGLRLRRRTEMLMHMGGARPVGPDVGRQSWLEASLHPGGDAYDADKAGRRDYTRSQVGEDRPETG